MKRFLLGLGSTLIILFAVLNMVGCSNGDKTRETLVKAGFSDIVITGWAPMGCGRDDTYCTSFSAVNHHGNRVSGVVGCGFWLKGCTIRF